MKDTGRPDPRDPLHDPLRIRAGHLSGWRVPDVDTPSLRKLLAHAETVMRNAGGRAVDRRRKVAA